jgi:hypothetical protein
MANNLDQQSADRSPPESGGMPASGPPAPGTSASQPPSSRPVDGSDYEVQPGDCISSIAFDHGFFWPTLWDHPANADLKAKRRDPNVLKDGDVVHIPKTTLRQESGATEQRHRFKRKGVPAKLKLRFLFNGRPRENLPFTIQLDGLLSEGMTDARGYLEFSIPPNAHEGILTLKSPNGEEYYRLDLGHLDPVDTPTGIQQRLRNLGFGCDLSREFDLQTADAARTFQSRHALNPTGEFDQAFRDKLKEVHGC